MPWAIIPDQGLDHLFMLARRAGCSFDAVVERLVQLGVGDQPLQIGQKFLAVGHLSQQQVEISGQPHGVLAPAALVGALLGSDVLAQLRDLGRRQSTEQRRDQTGLMMRRAR